MLALPALVADGSDVMVVRWLAPILQMGGVEGDVIPLDRGPRGFTRAVRELRRRRYRTGTLMSAAFSAAWLFRCGGVRYLRGTRTDGRGWLLSDRVDSGSFRGRHRIDWFKILLGQEAASRPASRPLELPDDRVSAWRQRLEGRPLVALFPGANAPARRWPVERFAETARRIAERCGHVIVLGGRGERALTARVAAGAGGVLDLGGQTDLFDLAAILALCDLVITNDTGPMHLAGAVGTPTVSLWGSSDPREVGQAGSRDTRVTGPDLPCRPCYRNHCHRQGSGTLLPDAHEECMRLIDVQDVVGAVEAALERGRANE